MARLRRIPEPAFGAIGQRLLCTSSPDVRAESMTTASSATSSDVSRRSWRSAMGALENSAWIFLVAALLP